MVKIFASVLLLMLIFASGMAQENILLVTYGPQAPPKEGDDDYLQVIFFQVPETVTDSLFLRIYDPDAGGDVDLRFRQYDTKTRFAFYGGSGAYSQIVLHSPHPNIDDLSSGTLLKEDIFGENALLNKKWHNFYRFHPTSGEKTANGYMFRLVVQGIAGNDGNAFDLRISRDQLQNAVPAGVKMFSYSPTVRLTSGVSDADIRFLIPEETASIQINSFDLAGAKVTLETAFRSGLPLRTSSQGAWSKTSITLEPPEAGREAAIRFWRGGETPNDAIFYVHSNTGKILPISLPAYISKPNARPQISKTILALSDCYSIVFDAQNSIDKDGDILTFYWDFGDGTSEEGSRVVHRYAEQKRYDAHLIVSDNSGQVSNSSYQKFPVVVNKPPLAVAGSDMTAAPGDALKFDGSASADPDGSITRYIWNFGDEHSAEGRIVSYTYNQAARYLVSLRVEDNAESPCKFDYDTLAVWINAAPRAVAGRDVINSVGNPIRFNASGSSDSDGEIISYEWDFGDGTKKSGMIVEHIYRTPGVYTARLTIRDNANVRNSSGFDEIRVVMNFPPVARAGTDVHVADGDRITLDASQSIDEDGQIIEYRWDFGDGNQASGAVVTHHYAAPGTYRVSLTVRDNSGTDSNAARDSLVARINARPIARAGNDQVVTSSEVQFDGSASSDPDGCITAYAWDFGDGSSSFEASPRHVYRNPGTYRVKLTVTDDSNTGNQQAADDIQIIVNEKPVADAGPDQISAPGQALTFAGGNSFDPDGNVAAYTWNFGDGNSATGETVQHIYSQPGIYTAQLTVQDNTGHENALDFAEALITVNAPPVAVAGNDIIAAPGQIVTLNGENSYDPDGGISKYRWNFSDREGQGIAQPTVNRSWLRPGIYRAALTVQDESPAQNNSHTSEVTIRINNRPIARAGKNISACESTISFDASESADADSDPLTYYWDFGTGGELERGRTVVHQFSKGGIYPVILIVDDGHGLANSRDSTAITVTINQRPVADAGPDETICAGEIALFNADQSVDPEGGALRYTWDFGDGDTAEGINPTKSYKAPGIYQVTLTVKDDSGLPCNADTDTRVLTVLESPVAIAGADMEVCANAEIQFDGSQSTDSDGLVNKYEWDFGDGTAGGGPTPVHIYKNPGVYRVVLTVTGDVQGDCDNINSDELLVTVQDAPLAQFAAPASAPIFSMVQFDASESISEAANIIDYSWDFGDGNTGAGLSPQHSYQNHGTYVVTLSLKTDADTECNTNIVRNTIAINAPPVAKAGSRQTVGAGQVTVFNAAGSHDPDGPISEFLWDFGDGNSGSGISASHTYQKSGRFPVVLTVRDNTDLTNNTARDTIWVTVNAGPDLQIMAAERACPGEAVNFNSSLNNAANGSLSYTWDFGDGNTADGASVSHAYANPGKYQVTLAADDGVGVENSRLTVSKTILVNTLPLAVAGENVLTCPGADITFDASRSHDPDGDALSYRWQFGDGREASGKIVTHRYEKSGIYTASLAVFDNTGAACSVSEALLTVTVNSTPLANAGPDKEAFYGGAHDDIIFDAGESSDPDGDALTYTWDFGDGTSGAGLKVFHVYSQPGNYTVTLTVSDGKGTACSRSVDTINVRVKDRQGDMFSKGNE